MNTQASGWGPQRRRGAVSLTFDNMGEALMLGRGQAIPPEQLGKHETVTVILPQLMHWLKDVPATYMIEAGNTGMYPDQIHAWARAGKDVGIHAWLHEPWDKLDATTRRQLLTKCIEGFENIGIRPRGFRPPGGALPHECYQEFRDAGLQWCSPLGDEGASRVEDGLAILPFAWHHVDAYMIDTKLPALRARNGDQPDAFTMAEWQATLDAALETARNRQCHVTMIFHPIVLLEFPDSRPVLQQFIRKLEQAQDLWVASSTDVSDWLQDQTKNSH